MGVVKHARFLYWYLRLLGKHVLSLNYLTGKEIKKHATPQEYSITKITSMFYLDREIYVYIYVFLYLSL